MSIKKTKYAIVNGLIIIVLIAIVVNQVIWLSNMYNLHQREFKAFANRTTLNSVHMEIAERTETMGGFRLYSGNLTDPNDTSRFFVKVTSKNPIFHFQFVFS